MVSIHTGKAYITNEWGIELKTLYLRHRRGNDPTKQDATTFKDVGIDMEAGPMEFTYELGDGSPNDYWWIKFVTNSGIEYKCKDDFSCSVRAGDDGIVYLTLHGDSSTLKVKKNHSSSCSCDMNKVGQMSPIPK
jgi:hypothetical protein